MNAVELCNCRACCWLAASTSLTALCHCPRLVCTAGYFKLLGKGQLPQQPVVVRAKFVSKLAEKKIKEVRCLVHAIWHVIWPPAAAWNCDWLGKAGAHARA